MRILVTGSAGHLGEALMRTFRDAGDRQGGPRAAIGTDLLASPYTDQVGSIVDREHVRSCLDGVDVVVHTATLHKPHIATHRMQEFVDTNVSGTLNLLEASVAAGVRAFVFTSTTSTFGRALSPSEGEPAAWITEETAPVPKNIYGVTKVAAEDLCELFHRKHGLPCLVLRTSRFFPEEDDDATMRARYSSDNAKVNELLHRRVELSDVVSAHLLAIDRAAAIGFRRYIISATTPFGRDDLATLRTDAPAVVARLFPDYRAELDRRGWSMFPQIDRVYDNALARRELGWRPTYDFRYALDRLKANELPRSALAGAVGSKRYHRVSFDEGPYPV